MTRLICACPRYTDIKDAILVTTSDADDLADLVLGTGRLYSVFVPSEDTVNTVRASVDAACLAAINRGMFVSTMKNTPVVVGQTMLPTAIPRTNMSHATEMAYAHRVEAGDCDTQNSEHEVAVAQEAARKFGLEIKVRIVLTSSHLHYQSCSDLFLSPCRHEGVRLPGQQTWRQGVRCAIQV